MTLENIAGKCEPTKSGQWSLADISGRVEVANPFGCEFEQPLNGSGIDVEVHCVKKV